MDGGTSKLFDRMGKFKNVSDFKAMKRFVFVNFVLGGTTVDINKFQQTKQLKKADDRLFDSRQYKRQWLMTQNDIQ